LSQEIWQNDLYGQLALSPPEDVNPVAGAVLKTLDDRRYQELRSGVLDDLHLYPGCAVLEAGCGPGVLLEGLHERVGPEGAVHGLDINPHFIAVAERRKAIAEIENAAFRVADCHTLPYENETFDAVVAEKLLMHVRPIRRAIEEMTRVLTPGGRLVLVDYDPYTIMAAGPDPSITARVMASAANLYASARAARESALTCVQAGLYVERVRGHLLVFEDPNLPSVEGVAWVWAEHAVAGRQVDRGTARRWLQAIERAASDGHFMIAVPYVITVAIRR
jgi:SAM-dependent methyltransferase